MSLFGGMSKGERNRIKIRVRTAMAAQTAIEGRFLGGRPPYGYHLVDPGPHPNPPRPPTANGCTGLARTRSPPRSSSASSPSSSPDAASSSIAEGLTRDGIPSPRPTTRPQPAPRAAAPGPRAPSGSSYQPPLHRPAGVEQAAQGRDPHRRRRRRARPRRPCAGTPRTMDLLRARRPTSRSSTTRRSTPRPALLATAERSARRRRHTRRRTPHLRVPGLIHCGDLRPPHAGAARTTARLLPVPLRRRSTPSPTASTTPATSTSAKTHIVRPSTAGSPRPSPPTASTTPSDRWPTPSTDDTDRTPTRQAARTPTIAECDHKLARYRAALDAGADPTVVSRLDRRGPALNSHRRSANYDRRTGPAP